MCALDVRTFENLELEPALASQLLELERASAAPTPFQTLELLATFARRDRVFQSGATPYLLVAFEGARAVGYLALRRVEVRVAGMRCAKLEPLLTLETDRPRLVARTGDLARCREAIFAHLRALPRNFWSLLELPLQDSQSELRVRPAWAKGPGFLYRTLPSRDLNPLPLPWADAAGYLAALGSSHRQNVRRHLRSVLRLRELAYLVVPAPEAASPLLESYLALEQRSWKARDEEGASVSNSAERVAYYRELFSPRQAFRAGLHLLLHGGRLAAGRVVLHDAGGLYFLHSAFEARLRPTTPGTLLFLLMIDDALRAGLGQVNLMPDFAYHKRRWLAETVPTSAVQIFRMPGLLGAKAVLGGLRRSVAAGEAAVADHNPVRRRCEQAEAGAAEVGSPPEPGPVDPRLALARAHPETRELTPPALRAKIELLLRAGVPPPKDARRVRAAAALQQPA